MSVDIAYKVSLILMLNGDRIRSFCPDNIFRPYLDLNLINLDFYKDLLLSLIFFSKFSCEPTWKPFVLRPGV